MEDVVGAADTGRSRGDGSRWRDNRLLWFVAVWGPVVLACGAIFALSSIPGRMFPRVGFPGYDKLVHAGIYAVLGLVVVRAVCLSTRWPFRVAALVTVLAGTAHGALDELHQGFVPHRAVQAGDLAADGAGVALACVVWWALVQRHRRRTDAG